MQVFNALNGIEMIEVIKDLIGKKLEATGEFKQHITFPWSKLSFAVGLVAYPNQGMEDTNPKIRAVSTETVVLEDHKTVSVLDLTGEPTTISVSGTEILDTPDKTRVESKLPVPTPVVGPGGQVFDKPQVKVQVPLKGTK